MKAIRVFTVAAGVALTVAPSPLIAQRAASSQEHSSGWRVVYAADSLGARTIGSKEALLRAVRAGRPIRIGWEVPWQLPDGTKGVFEHAAPAIFLTIHQGEVFAQIAPILGQSPHAREPVVEFRIAPARQWYGLFDTRGWLRGYFVGSDSATSGRFVMRWYAPDP